MPNHARVKTWYAISFALQMGFLVVAPIVVFLFIGIWVDKQLLSSPFFAIVSILLGIAIAIYEIYHLLLPLNVKVEKNNK